MDEIDWNEFQPWEPAVSASKSKKTKNDRNDTTRPMTQQEIVQLLSTFKTKQCPHQGERHDTRICLNYHGLSPEASTDYRRNPYEEAYSLEECRTVTETLYHPDMFHTSMCRRVAKQACPFSSSLCGYAHIRADLRTRAQAAREYESFLLDESERRRQFRLQQDIGSLVGSCIEQKSTGSWKAKCEQQWHVQSIAPTTIFFPLAPVQYFLVSRSSNLFHELCDIALSLGLCTIEVEGTSCGEGQLRVKGINPQHLFEPFAIRLVLDPTSPHFATEEIECMPRVMATLSEKGISALSKSPDVYVDVFEKEHSQKAKWGGKEITTTTHGIRIVAVHSRGRRAEDRIADIKEILQFWIKNEGYDKFVTCGCCMEERNLDQGATCDSGHFYCSITEGTAGELDVSESCFTQMVRAQIVNLRSRDDGALICPECDAPYSINTVAQHLPADVFKECNEALVARCVEKESKILARRFDEQLNQKVEELMKNYENADEVVKMQARRKAQEARDTIMNLSCPHPGCRAYYAEFTGCMALECASCKKHFCGYCHAGFETSGGTHQHVRECLMNETNNGSYYAEPEEIKTAQRRYRTREIKKFLRNFKKELQNAIVIELTRDLSDLGIQPEALFEVGNLHENLRGPD
jgi:hypothetical protein